MSPAGDETPPLGPGTRAVHAGEEQPSPRHPLVVPIYQTAPFSFDSAAELTSAFASGELAGLYSRYGNPTVRLVEEKLAALEGAADAVAFASGMAAIVTTLSTLLASGDRLLAAVDLYGGTHAWLGWLATHHPEIAVDRVPLAGLLERLAGGPAERTRAVYLESPTNPLLACCDLARAAELAHAAGARLVVDSTFATPVLQNPIALGADLVVHSATKFLAGHSDVTAGLVAGARESCAAIRHSMILLGGCLDPHAAFLVGRGMKTLALRIERQSASAALLAERLASHPRIERVHYPGLDPVARRQMRAGGPMLAFVVAGGEAGASAFLDRLRLVRIYPSLGGVESGVLLPAATSHRQFTPAQRDGMGISGGLVRMSVGIEEVADLEADLLQALAS